MTRPFPVGDPVLIGRTWHWPDGTTVPLVAGGSDIGTTTPDPAAAPATGPADGSTPAPATTDPDTTTWAPEAQSYITRLRQENQQYREKWQPYERQFGAMDSGDREVFNRFLSAYAGQDNEAMLDWALAQARHLAGERWSEIIAADGQIKPEPAAPAGQPGDEAEQPMTRKQLEAWYAERQAQETKQREFNERVTWHAEDVQRKIEAAGYPDINSAEARHILVLAQSMNGNVEKAIEDFKAWEAQVGTRYAGEKAQQAAAAAGTGPTGAVPDGAKAPGPGSKDPAYDAMMQRLNGGGAGRPRNPDGTFAASGMPGQ